MQKRCRSDGDARLSERGRSTATGNCLGQVGGRVATFNATSQIFGYMDTVVSQFVAANLGRIITAVTPVVALGLTMSLTMEGLFLMARPGQEPLTRLVERFV